MVMVRRRLRESWRWRRGRLVASSCGARKCGVSNENPLSRSPLSSADIWIEDLKSPIADSFEAAADYYDSSNPPPNPAKGQSLESEWSIESAKRQLAPVQ